MTRKLLLAATLLAAPFVSSGVTSAQPVTGLYIGAAGGANFMEQQRLKSLQVGSVSTPLFGQTSSDVGVTGLGSLGYGFGNGLRVELEGSYRYNRLSGGQSPGTTSFGGREQKYGPMFNVLFDLDVGSPYVFPYVGGGAGYQWVEQRSAQTIGVFRNTINGTDSSFAYQAIAGLSFPIPPVVGLSLTAEYRYFALAGDRDFGAATFGPASAAFGRIKTTGDYNHSLMLGLRYAFNVAPPPVAAPVPVAAPAPQNAQSYLVSFDWDRADLTDRARQIIAEAAQATTRVQVTRIEVAGHADRSGTPRYNQGLSARRAQNVASELVRLGVPRQAISVQGYGDTRPLVPTAAGVREPQNRRVEIVLR